MLGRRKKNPFRWTCLVVTTREQRQYADYVKTIKENMLNQEEERAKMLSVARDLLRSTPQTRSM